MYGDEGNDKMFGKNEMMQEYMWGGAGHDLMYGGYGATISILNGNEGDDKIWPGYYGDNANENPAGVNALTIKGGKGNDYINEMRVNAAGTGFEPNVNRPNHITNIGGAKS